jgi:hypothetical protein
MTDKQLIIFFDISNGGMNVPRFPKSDMDCLVKLGLVEKNPTKWFLTDKGKKVRRIINDTIDIVTEVPSK